MVDIAKSRLPWDSILGAEEVRAYKPMPEAYYVRQPEFQSVSLPGIG